MIGAPGPSESPQETEWLAHLDVEMGQHWDRALSEEFGPSCRRIQSGEDPPSQGG